MRIEKKSELEIIFHFVLKKKKAKALFA